MAFPVTIDAVVGGAEQPGKFATFLNGTDRYQIQFLITDADMGEVQLLAKKSTDSGATWASADASNGPELVIFSSPLMVPYTVVQIDADTLTVIFSDSGGPQQIDFVMGAVPAWAGSAAAIPPPPGGGSAGEGSFLLPQMCAGYRGLDNSIVLVLVGNTIALSDVGHAICSFSVYDIAGDSWSSWLDLDYEDYVDITTWDMIPCGVGVDDSTGRATVLMQQVARAGPGNSNSTSFNNSTTWDAPLDADTSADVDCYGSGAGSGGDVGLGNGGGSGGGGGAHESGTVTIAPGGSYTVTIPDGGAVLGDPSGPTVFEGVSANPGQHGVSGASQAGGAGGTGTHPGGDGGSSGSGTGGGGGGTGGPTGAGNPGGDGGSPNPVLGGSGGTSANGLWSGGHGGNAGANPPNFGQPGNGPGTGGGGQGDNADLTPNAGVGQAGQVEIRWNSVRNTHDCRLYQQAILADNSLGTLEEITEGAYPSRPKGVTPVPISFDMGTLDGDVWITFTGATSTSGRDNIAVGNGASADPVGFSFQNVSSGNGGNDIDSCPAIALKTGTAYCCYLQAPDGGPLAFVYRADSGGGMGSPTTIGSISLPDEREFGRLQANVLATLPEITFGTPTTAYIDFSWPS